MNFYHYIIEPVISIFLPALCIHCQRPLPQGRRIICQSCFNGLPRLLPEHKKTFLKRVPVQYFDHLFILYQFSPLFQELVHLLKYQRFLTVARYFAEALASRLKHHTYDVITAVPLNPVRLRERGYNQSAIIAKVFAELLQQSFSENILIRLKNTKSQTKLSRSERIENVHNAFITKENIRGRSVLIIDDVITTGSTLNECARMLRQNGAERIDIAAMATPIGSLLAEQHHTSLDQLLFK